MHMFGDPHLHPTLEPRYTGAPGSARPAPTSTSASQKDQPGFVPLFSQKDQAAPSANGVVPPSLLHVPFHLYTYTDTYLCSYS